MELPSANPAPNSNGGSPLYHSPQESPSDLREGNVASSLTAAAKTTTKSTATASDSSNADANSPNSPSLPLASTSYSPPSSPRRPSMRNRARTNSTKLLHRFTSRGSVIEDGTASGSQPPGSPTSEKSAKDSVGKIDRAALSRARGKYKSGVNWDGLPNGDIEPWMETGDVGGSPREEKQLLQAIEDDSMLSTGGTAAAKAYYNSMNLSLSSSIFPAQQRAASEAQLRAANELAAQQRIAPPGMGPMLTHQPQQRPRGNSHSTNSSGRHSSSDRLPSINTAVQALQGSQPATAATLSTDTASSTTTTPTSRAGLQNGKNQRGLGPNSTLPPSAWKGPEPGPSTVGGSNAASEPRPSESARASPDQEVGSIEGSKSPAASIRSKRRTFLGLGSKSTDKVDKVGKKSRRSSTTSFSEAVGDTSVDGAGRRRRFQDTRELDLLAAELARDAAIEALGPPQPGYAQWSQTPSMSGSRTPAERRTSGGGVLGMQGVSPMATPSAHSLANGSSSGPLQPFTPPFAREGRAGSPGSSTPGSPRSLSEALPGAFAQNRSGALGKSAAGSLSTTQKAQVSGLPTEMLTGLGDGPYPMGPSSTDGDGMSSGYNTPRRSRVGSASTGSIVPAKKSVLSMTMHDPEAEMQGLTKPPKSGKNTPWGSRAPSRNVTPRSSATKLNEAFKQQQAPAVPLPRRSASEEPQNTSVASAASAATVTSAASTTVSIPTPVAEAPAQLRDDSMASAAPRSAQRSQSPTVARGPSPQPPKASMLAPPGPTAEPSPAHLEADSRPSTIAPSGKAGSTTSSKQRARRSFLSVFGKGNKDVEAPPSDKRVTSNGRLAPPPTTTSAVSLSSEDPSQRSSTILTPTTSGQNSSVTRLTPSSELSQPNGNGQGHKLAAQALRAPSPQRMQQQKVEGDQLTVRRSRSPVPAPSPTRPERSVERIQASAPEQAQSWNAAQAQSMAPAKPASPGAAANVGKRSASAPTSGPSTTSSAASSNAPKRPGNLKRLFSKFGGSNAKPSKASSDSPTKAAGQAPPMPNQQQQAAARGPAPALGNAPAQRPGNAPQQPQSQQEPPQAKAQPRARITAGPQSANVHHGSQQRASGVIHGSGSAQRGGMIFSNGMNGSATPNGRASPYASKQQRAPSPLSGANGGVTHNHQSGDISTGSSGQESVDFKMVGPPATLGGQQGYAPATVSVGR